MSQIRSKRTGLNRTGTLGSYTWTKPITPVSVSKTLMGPLNLGIDPTVQAVRTQEKNQMKGLNNRFASLIDQVRMEEQKNKKLETHWKLLQEQTTASSNIEPMLKAYISDLQKKLDVVLNDKSRLDQENDSIHRHVEVFKTKYEDEINKKSEAENNFIFLKKDVDAGYLSKMDLEEMVASLVSEINFLRTLHDMELRELQESLKEMSVVVQMDNSRALNMDQIVSQFKDQYADVAARSRTEVENSYKVKIDQMASMTDQYSSELSETKADIVELKRLISRLENEIHSAKTQCAKLNDQISDEETSNANKVKDAEARIEELKQVLRSDKLKMAEQIKNYQELMNLKLAMDIEIATYNKLLEGEEERFGHQSIISIHNTNGVTQRIGHQSIVSNGHVAFKQEREIVNGHFPDAEYQPWTCEYPSEPHPVLKYDEPEIAICYFPAPKSPVMKTPESPRRALVIVKTTEILDTPSL